MVIICKTEISVVVLSSVNKKMTKAGPAVAVLTNWRSRCTWETSCYSWIWSGICVSCRWGEARSRRPPRRVGTCLTSAILNHWLQWLNVQQKKKKHTDTLKRSWRGEGGDVIRWKNATYLALDRPLTVTFRSPFPGWVCSSTWTDTSPIGLSTPEPSSTHTQTSMSLHLVR